MLDECLFLALELGKDELESVIQQLRKARREVITKLIARGIPANEIATIGEADSGATTLQGRSGHQFRWGRDCRKVLVGRDGIAPSACGL